MHTEQSTSEEARYSILDALGRTLAAKRRDAVAARAASGIEDEWTQDEEFYQGYDDANRHEFARTANKPSATGTTEVVKSEGSVVFPNITQPYCDAVSARVGDVLLPTDNRNFEMEPTTIPDMLEGPVDEAPATQAMPDPQAMQGAPEGMPGMPGAPQAPQAPQESPQAKAESDVRKYKAEATKRAKKAQERIDDWLGECDYHAEQRKMFDDTVKLGSGCIKGPVPVKRRSSVWQQSESGESELVVIEEIKPASMRIDPWNLYPDFPACGENIHNGSFIWEYDQISERKLEEMKGLPGYIDIQIDKCLEEGPIGRGEESRRSDIQARSSRTLFDIWYFHGNIKTDELKAAGCDCDDDKASYPAKMTMVNDRVIGAALNPLDTGAFPYDLAPWKRRPGMPWGQGLARQLRTPQRIVTGATRRLMDNAGLGSGPQIVVRRGVQPQNGTWEIKPMKIWVEEDDATGQAPSPLSAVLIPMLQQELTAIIMLGMKMAEDVTGMPAMMQGQQGSAPDTVGGMEILNNNANAVLRRIARMFDSCVTEPHIRRYYAWLMQHGDDPTEKGDFQIIARGSTALVERDIQNREMVNVLQLCQNPVYGKNPKKAMDEYLRSRRFDPTTFDYTEEELAKMAAQPPQPAPQVQIAEIREKGAMERTQLQGQITLKKTQIEAEADIHRTDVDTDRDTALVNAQAEKNANDAALRMKELELKKEIEILKYSTQQKISLEEAKVALARDSMRLNVQKELAATAGAMNMRKTYTPPQVATPAMEPAGQAPDGQAFQR